MGPSRKIAYVDMDNVLVDILSVSARLEESVVWGYTELVDSRGYYGWGSPEFA